MSENDDLAGYAGNPDFVLSLARGLRVITAFQGETNGLSVAEVAARTKLSRAAVRRLLVTLELLGYAEHIGAIYRLKVPILRLGFSYLSSHSLPVTAQPILEAVSEKIRESCSLTILDQDQIVYVARAAANRVMSVGLSVGTRLPAYCTSMGRVLLAGLPSQELKAYLNRVPLKRMTPKTLVAKAAVEKAIDQVRRNDYAVVDEELEIGLRSIAVPVRSREGKIVAAMNTGVHSSRVALADLDKRFLPVLRENAELLGLMLR